MTSSSTRWTIIRGAAAGDLSDRQAFAERYESVIRSYLRARWRHPRLIEQIDDAAQEVFLTCFRESSPLLKAGPEWSGGFRGFLYGVVRNVARGFEKQLKRSKEQHAGAVFDLDRVASDDDPVEKAFDRAWALSLMQQAARRQAASAERNGGSARLRVELLRLRFQGGLPIRDIAKRWEADPARLHHEYAKARKEFQACLMDVVRIHQGGTHVEVESECLRLLAHFD